METLLRRTDCSHPQNHLPLQPHALRVSRQPWAPFNSSLQLNNPLWLLKICMFISIPVWLRSPCPIHSQCGHLVLWPTSPCPWAWTSYRQEIKTLTWGKKSVGYKHTGLSLEQRADLARTTASHCWEEAAQSLRSPCWPVARMWMGLVLNLGAAGVTCLPSQCLFEPWMHPGNTGTAHAPKETLGSRRKCFLSKRPLWRSSVLGKIKVIEALRVKYKADLQLCFPTIKLPRMQRGKKEGGCENGWAGWASV